MIPRRRLTSDKPVHCEIFLDKRAIICYGFDRPGLLAHKVGAISLHGISIEKARSQIWEQEGQPCFYNEFFVLPQNFTIKKSLEIQALIETQGKLVFNNKSVEAKRFIVERIAEEIEMQRDIANLIPIVAIDVKKIEKNAEKQLRIEIQGKDHPFLLYMLCDALAEHNFSVLELRASTLRDSIRDSFIVVPKAGTDIADINLNNLYLSLLLYIKFAYFIQNAPDPYLAIQRLHQIIKNMIENSILNINQLLDANSHLSKELIKVLGYGDYMWEDFIKTNVRNIQKIFSKTQYRRKGLARYRYESELVQKLSTGTDFEEKIRIINNFKDEQRYRVDIDALMMKDTGFLYLSRHLSELTKVVIRQALYLIEKELKKKFGIPRSAAGIESKWCLFGLGKFGGGAMGFASDIEAQLIFTDHGHTDGTEKIENKIYFNTLLKRLRASIQARKKGIFTLDLRLRPYGEDGPLTVQLDNFIEYYRPGGPAHSIERLALTRMRPVAGNIYIAEQLLKLRDDFIYLSSSIDPSEIFSMRQKQIDKEVKKGRRNAKFGPGALLDVEINVQLLQVRHGKKYPEFRQSSMYHVLQSLRKIEELDKEDMSCVLEAYEFFRRLINALRLRRGNAQDVSLPPDNDWELTHLARRMGYKRTVLSTREQLLLDFDTHSAIMFRFARNYVGKEAVRLKDLSPAALVYVEESDCNTVPLLRIFKERKTALNAIHLCTKAGILHREFAKILLLSWQKIVRCGNSDALIVLLARLAESFKEQTLREFYLSLLRQPNKLFILLDVFSGSRYLAEEILKNPAHIEEICSEEIAQKKKTFDHYLLELKERELAAKTKLNFFNVLRDYKKLQILKIITQDICLVFPLKIVFSQLSDLASAISQIAFSCVCKKNNYDGRGISIFAFGKLGAKELNYSSDLDLLCVYTEHCALTHKEILTLFKNFVACLFEYTSSGQAYRVDLRLQPYGQNHEVTSQAQLEEYYKNHARLWEMQACIKLSCIAGDKSIAEPVLHRLQNIIKQRLQSISSKTIMEEIHSLRQSTVQHLKLHDDAVLEIKQSWGGLRDIEFMVQGLQLMHYQDFLPLPDTLSALKQLQENRVISAEHHDFLAADYRFLRRIEHFLQVYDDKQLHAIPEHDINFKRRLTWLVIGESDEDVLISTLRAVKKRVSEWYHSVKDSFY